MNSKTRKKQTLRNNEYYDIQQIYDKLYSDSKRNKVFVDLMSLVRNEANIKLAYRNIKNNKGANTRGTDILTTEHISHLNVETYVVDIQRQLADYKPKKVRRVMIPKPNGDKRPLGIPCIEDRLIQQCIKQVLEPICEAKFHPHSYGFRPNRSAKHAIARFNSLVHKSQTHYVVDVDIKGFFDNVDHAKLMKQMWSMGIRDKNLLSVIKKILTAEIEGEGIPKKGTPQGGILSPLLANIVLNELDWWISDQWETFKTPTQYSANSSKYGWQKRRKLKEMWLIRYADDFKILCRDSKTAFKIYNATKQWLKERLKLDISPEKSKVTNLRKNHTEFLGIALMVKPKKKKYVCNSNMADSRKKNVLRNIRKQISIIHRNKSPGNVMRLNAMILGIHNYYCMASHIVKDFNKIDFLILEALKKLEYSTKGQHSLSYKKNYGKYTSRKIMKVCGVDIFPIYGCTNVPPRGFNQQISNYTEEGRKLVHDSISPMNKLIVQLLENTDGQSVEYCDNRISLMVAQKGRCAITGRQLVPGKMHCHHKKRRRDGGTDKYQNLMWLNDDVHRLIHAVDNQIVSKYLNMLKLDEQELAKVNRCRKLAGNYMIN